MEQKQRKRRGSDRDCYTQSGIHGTPIIYGGVRMEQNWFDYLLGGVVALLAWLGKRMHEKVENSVSRSELRDVLHEMREERRAMHDQNSNRLDRIHERVDALYRNGGGR